MGANNSADRTTSPLKWAWPIVLVGVGILIWKKGYAFGQWLFDLVH
ncbi:MAG: hypothetical protein JNJ91_11150 [Flavobacteriales bacterium]|jgi:hypothetical protein|nr:hypothetical protein [Flavobacteriales bacterium]